VPDPHDTNTMAKQYTRPRSNAFSEPKPKPAEYKADNIDKIFTPEMQQQGFDKGMRFLSTIQADWNSIGMSVVGTAASALSAAKLITASEPESNSAIERASSELNELVSDGMSAAVNAVPDSQKLNDIKEYMEAIWNKIKVKIEESPKIKKALDALKIGLNVLLAQLKELILSAEVLKTLVPFYGVIKGTYHTIKGVIDTRSHHNNWLNLQTISESFAEGIPSIAMQGFIDYVETQRLIEGAKTTYTGAKTLCSLLLQVCTMGISSVFEFASKIAEAVSSFAYAMYETYVVVKFTGFCKEWGSRGKNITDEQFREICAGAPLISCIFIGCSGAQMIPPHCLGALFYSGKKTIGASEFSVTCINLMKAKYLAREYYRKSPVHLTTSRKEYEWWINILEGKSKDYTQPTAQLITAATT